jgi:hypothetical protein
MSKPRRTPESQVLAYFRSAPLGEALMVAGLVRDLMKERVPQRPKAAKKASKPDGEAPDHSV